MDSRDYLIRILHYVENNVVDLLGSSVGVQQLNAVVDSWHNLSLDLDDLGEGESICGRVEFVSDGSLSLLNQVIVLFLEHICCFL